MVFYFVIFIMEILIIKGNQIVYACTYLLLKGIFVHARTESYSIFSRRPGFYRRRRSNFHWRVSVSNRPDPENPIALPRNTQAPRKPTQPFPPSFPGHQLRTCNHRCNFSGNSHSVPGDQMRMAANAECFPCSWQFRKGPRPPIVFVQLFGFRGRWIRFEGEGIRIPGYEQQIRRNRSTNANADQKLIVRGPCLPKSLIRPQRKAQNALQSPRSSDTLRSPFA